MDETYDHKTDVIILEDPNYWPIYVKGEDGKRGYEFCEKCDLVVEKGMYHCDDCQVCCK